MRVGPDLVGGDDSRDNFGLVLTNVDVDDGGIGKDMGSREMGV